jgi:hypothetical protein
MRPSPAPMPSFLILGAAKAGTTSLHEYLCQHPEVKAPLVKEIHYFDHSYRRGLGWYQGHFPRLAAGEVTGESTPYYLFHPAVPARVRRDLPDARFIVLLRNPIDRLVSQHNHELADGFEDLPLEDALAREPERIAAQEERVREEPGFRCFSHQHHSYAARGRYAEQLERWFGYFDRERFLVLDAADLFESPCGVVEDAQRHLGLRELRPEDVSVRNARSYEGISDDLRRQLHTAFASHNERLYDLLGRDFGWS